MIAGSLAKYLERFKNLTAPDESVRSALSEYLATSFSLDVPPSAMRVRRGIIWCDTDSVRRSELVLHKQAILTFLRERFGERAPGDIR